MRVRYGKPIKVKSLLGQSNIPFSYTAANVTFYPLTTGTFHSYAGPSVLNIKYVNRQANHKYFLFLNTDIVYSWSYFGIWDTYNTRYEGNRTAPIKDGNNYYTLISPTTSATNGVPTFQFGVTQNLPAIANYALIIDLTEIGLDNLTAQEFYNKYNKYFPLIATGEQITIDDKAGQVSYSSQKSLKSIVGKQAGLTADNSFNRYSVTSVAAVALCNNKFGYSTVSDLASRFTDDDAIQIVEGHKYFVHVKVHNMLDRSAQRWMCMRFTSTAGASYALSGNIYSYTWKFTTDTVSAILTGTTTGNLAYTYFGDFPDSLKMTIATEYPESYLIIDMTALGEDSLTVEEFYTKYKGYFSDLENGKQILVGKGKIAGGSSDIYYGYNQLLQNGNFSNGTFGWYIPHNKSTYTYTNGELMFTITTAMTDSSWGDGGYATTNNDQRISLYANHKYFITCEVYTEKSGQGSFYYGGSYDPYINVIANEWQRVSSIRTQQNDSIGNVVQWSPFYCTGMDVGTKHGIRNMILIDLTEWYGQGKEPSTVEEFKEKFTKEYYGTCITPIKLTKYQIEALPNYGYNQLIKNGNFTDSSNWNVTENAQRRPSINNNIYTIETLTQGYSVSVEQLNNAQFLYSNHKYLVHFEAKGTSAGPSTHLQASIKLYSYANSATIFNQPYQELTNEFKDFYSIITPTQTTSGTSASGGFRIYYGSNTGLSYVGDKVQMKNIYIIDLTDWYGEGKEPTTIEEFKQTFPNKYYAYSKKRLLNKYMINKLEN